MKQYLLIFFLFLTSFSVKADYRPLRLYEMILGADKIVYGEIIALDSLTYTLKVEQNLTGSETSLTILKFRNWPCAWRWTDYQVGQRLFLFLREHKGKLHSMSAGNEGELPLLDNFVYINGLSLNSPPAMITDSLKQVLGSEGVLISNKYKIHGSDYFGHKVSLSDFLFTISTIRNCFELHFGAYHVLEKVTITCDYEDLERKSQQDNILGWAFEELKEKTGDNSK